MFYHFRELKSGICFDNNYRTVTALVREPYFL